jgi:RNA polymerase sigma-70 factor, ECF subfamily
VALYDQLAVLAPTPVVALNRAVAVAEVDGPDAALALVDELELPQHPLFHSVRADLLRRLGRSTEAAEAYGTALSLTGNAPERAFLERRLASLR